MFEMDDKFILIAETIAALLSIIGCFFVITMITLFRKYQVFTQRLILYLSVAALFNSMFYFDGNFETPRAICKFQAWGQTYFDWSVLLWVSCIAFNLYWNAVQGKPSTAFERKYKIVACGLPLVISLLPFIGNHYGRAGMWCWIVDDWKWRFGIWFIPLYILIAAMFVVYTYILHYVNKQERNWEGHYDPESERRRLMLKEDVKPLKLYPFVYLAVSLFPLINRIHDAVSDEPIFILVLLHVVTQPLQGVANAIVFVLDKDMRSNLNSTKLLEALLYWNHRLHRRDNDIEEYPSSTHEDIALIETNQNNATGTRPAASNPP